MRQLSPKSLLSISLFVALLSLPWLSIAQDNAEEDPFGPSPFDQFQDDDEEERELPPVGEDPETSEVLPPQQVITINDELEPPQGPVELRFQWTDSLRYDVNNTSRMGFEERPDLRQIYRSGMAVEYTPISNLQREIIPAWRMQVDVPEPEGNPTGQVMLATIYNFTGVFEEPRELADPAKTHQILKDAAFSFQITDRGEVFDVRIHPPTNPLARASLEEFVRLLGASHPLLPQEAVEPGATWSDTISLSFEDGNVVKTQDVELSYTFDSWEQCGAVYCAHIKVEQEVEAAARYLEGPLETQASSAGGGSGWFLLAQDSGKVVRSRWNVSTRGRTLARQRDGDQIRELAQSRFHIEVDSSVELLGWDFSGYEIVDTQ